MIRRQILSVLIAVALVLTSSNVQAQAGSGGSGTGAAPASPSAKPAAPSAPIKTPATVPPTANPALPATAPAGTAPPAATPASNAPTPTTSESGDGSSVYRPIGYGVIGAGFCVSLIGTLVLATALTRKDSSRCSASGCEDDTDGKRKQQSMGLALMGLGVGGVLLGNYFIMKADAEEQAYLETASLSDRLGSVRSWTIGWQRSF